MATRSDTGVEETTGERDRFPLPASPVAHWRRQKRKIEIRAISV
ncbi:MAG: hypothetical protein AB1589_13435 [Cyanobacteriota bacterium]